MKITVIFYNYGQISAILSHYSKKLCSFIRQSFKIEDRISRPQNEGHCVLLLQRFKYRIIRKDYPKLSYIYTSNSIKDIQWTVKKINVTYCQFGVKHSIILSISSTSHVRSSNVFSEYKTKSVDREINYTVTYYYFEVKHRIIMTHYLKQ